MVTREPGQDSKLQDPRVPSGISEWQVQTFAVVMMEKCRRDRDQAQVRKNRGRGWLAWHDDFITVR